MRLKKAIILGAVLGLVSIPLLALADPDPSITINNQTSADSAVEINHVCSGVLGLDTPSHTSRSYDLVNDLNPLCGKGFTTCNADIYTTKYCTGTKIGTAVVTSRGGALSLSGSVSGPYALSFPNTSTAVLSGP